MSGLVIGKQGSHARILWSHEKEGAASFITAICVCGGGVALCGKPFPGTQIGGGMSQSLLGSWDSGRFHHCQLQTDSDWRHQWTHGEM